MQRRRASFVFISRTFSLSRARARFPTFCNVSDITVIHYYELTLPPRNANARINIYYAGKKFSGILRLPREGYFEGIIMQHLASRI